MRLIASFKDEKDAYAFHVFLMEKEVENSHEIHIDPHSSEITHYIWVTNEDDMDKALSLYEAFKQDAETRRQNNLPKEDFEASVEAPKAAPIKNSMKIKFAPRSMLIRIRTPVTRWVVWACVMVFLVQIYQGNKESKKYPSLMQYVGMTPIKEAFVYDMPKAYERLIEFFKKYPDINLESTEALTSEQQAVMQGIDKLPMWKGISYVILEWPQSKTSLEDTLFGKIRMGQIWRIWTPVFLHHDVLHILFNMLWLWLLGRQVEIKIGKFRYLMMMLILAAVTNTFQYVMSGPFFLGYSGVICGLGGFIWIRLKEAPWEGYLIQKSTLVFLGIFVLGMLLLQLVSFFLQYFHVASFAMNIGNTAHITGVLVGMMLAKVPYFYRLRQ